MHSQFHTPRRYFLSHSVGCLPRVTKAAVSDLFWQPWQNAGGNAWPQWLDVINDFRSAIAQAIGASAADICPQTNVSSGLTKILYSLPKREGRNVIVLSPQDFPTIGFALKQAERTGFELRFIDGDPAALESWRNAIDEHVFMVHITHALSNTSHLLPVSDICALAKTAGAVSVVDIAQSVGVVPIDVSAWQADFALGTSVKFICGGPGACFLYVAPHIIGQCEPIDVGWFSHENPFEMDIDNFRYAPDALRFFGGTPSPAPYAAALTSLRLWQANKPVYNTVQTTLTKLSDAVPDSALVSPRETKKRGGTLVIAPQNRTPLRAALDSANILHDERNEGFRFSVHGYTLNDDVDALLGAFSACF